jgi:succinate---hydroxymethylglutarate CoA-transferase
MPSKIKEFGFDYKSLSELNPSLIYAEVAGFPQDSEWANKAAFDLTIQAMSGFMHITGEPSGPPQKVGWAVTDVLTSQQLFGGIMSAIL